MNRVTIGDLLEDYEDDKIDIITGVQAHDIEIVPRKIVEMIIDKCKEHASGPKPNDYIVGVAQEADWIGEYAESLLDQFEFGRNDD